LPEAGSFESMKKSINHPTQRIISVTLLLFLFLGNIVLSQLILSLNINLSEVDTNITKISSQNAQLKVYMAKYTSTQYLLDQAERYGFRQTNKIVFLENTDVLAKND